MTSGKDLKLKRVAADVKQKDLAAALGVRPATVNLWEARRVVTDATAERYLIALATFATSAESPEAVA